MRVRIEDGFLVKGFFSDRSSAEVTRLDTALLNGNSARCRSIGTGSLTRRSRSLTDLLAVGHALTSEQPIFAGSRREADGEVQVVTEQLIFS